ncbi:hypothetical protein ACMCRM_001687, partial [Campylobacter jejuni]
IIVFIKFLFKENYMEGASGGSIFVTILLFVLYMLPAIIVWLVCLIWSFTGSFKQTIIIKEKNEK